MTAPYPPAAVGKTAVYGIPYLAPGAPAGYFRAVAEDAARAVDTALAAKGAAPPGAADLAVLAGRVSGLEATGWTQPGNLNGWANYGAGFGPLRYRRQGPEVRIVGTLAGRSNLPADTLIFTLPEGYRPAYITPMDVFTAPSTVIQCVVHPDGRVLLSPAGSVGYMNFNALVPLG